MDQQEPGTPEQTTLDLPVDDLEVPTEELENAEATNPEVPTEELENAEATNPEGAEPTSEVTPDAVIDEKEKGTEEDTPPDLSAPNTAPPLVKQTPVNYTAQQEEYDALNQEYIIALDEKVLIDQMIKELGKRMALIGRTLFSKNAGHVENQKGIQAYLQRQKEVRAKRVANRNAILKGLSLADALPDKGSKLDAAMARKTARGGKRPTYPQRNT